MKPGCPWCPQVPSLGVSGPRGARARLGVAAGVFLRPTPEILGVVVELTGQILAQHPLRARLVQQLQQVLQHCGHQGVSAGAPPAVPALSRGAHPPWMARVVGFQFCVEVRGWQTRPVGSTPGW